MDIYRCSVKPTQYQLYGFAPVRVRAASNSAEKFCRVSWLAHFERCARASLCSGPWPGYPGRDHAAVPSSTSGSRSRSLAESPLRQTISRSPGKSDELISVRSGSSNSDGCKGSLPWAGARICSARRKLIQSSPEVFRLSRRSALPGLSRDQQPELPS